MYNTIQKTIAAWAFNHYIAYYYFDNVNVNQLKVAFERGEVELENLPIKKDALQHLNLPMEVVSGMVGRLSIKVPLLTMLTDSWVIRISDLMVIVAPKKLTESEKTDNINIKSSLNDSMQENFDTSSIDFSVEDDPINDGITSEETKLAEFYTSFSSAVSSIVRDIHKNIRLEIESMTVLFEDFEHGLAKFNVKSLLLHRPKSSRNLLMENLSIYLSGIGSPQNRGGDDLIHLNCERSNLDIQDEASNNMQLVVVKSSDTQSDPSTNSTQETDKLAEDFSELKIEGTLRNVTIEQIRRSDRGSGPWEDSDSGSASKEKEGFLLSKRNIMRCDSLKLEFKLNHNRSGESNKPLEKNLHIKVDLIGMQYIHSQRIYEITTHRLMNLVRFIVKLQSMKPSDTNNGSSSMQPDTSGREKIRKYDENNLNKLLVINIEEGLLYIVEDGCGSSATPLLEFSLDDCRILQFSGRSQQNGFVFAKVGCSYFNRNTTTWDSFLKPWPFNLSWDNAMSSMSSARGRKIQQRQISINSDEIAEFVLTSGVLDLGNVSFKRVFDDLMHQKLWPLATTLSPSCQTSATDLNSIFVIHNETGHKLYFSPLEEDSEYLDYRCPSAKSSPTISLGGDSSPTNRNRWSGCSRDSPDICKTLNWTSVDVGDSVSFEYDTLPIYRRHISDFSARSRSLLVRVEGWKTLIPVSIDKTGLFFREACSDRVVNEDTYIVISINLEKGSARKIITIRSPLNLINSLDTTLEVLFVESNQALYIKPNTDLAVPLPYLFDRMHVRPCNVGVNMSERALLWDKIQNVHDTESKIHRCHPITVTDHRHASYCTSQSYRICVCTRRESPKFDEDQVESASLMPIPVFSIKFITPLTLINLLPCKIHFNIGEIDGVLPVGGKQNINLVDTTKPTSLSFRMNGFPSSKPINIDPGATGSFHHTLEMVDKKNRSLYLNAEIELLSLGDEPAVQVVISAPFWFINKTRLPLIFKQEGAILEGAGQFREHEDSPVSTTLFSFYETELEPPWLCSMRLGKSKGLSMWSDGFTLDKGSGERRISFIPRDQDGNAKMSKTLIDITIRRGLGRYSSTVIVTFKARYGCDPLTKTPRKSTMPSPQNYKLTSYNHNANLAERIAGSTISLFDSYRHRCMSDISLSVPGLKLTLLDNEHEQIMGASVENISLKCTTNMDDQIIDCSIQDIRIENIMPDCEKSIILDRVSLTGEDSEKNPALRLIIDKVLRRSFGTTFFKQVQVSLCEMALNIEEKLVLKLVEFMNYGRQGRMNSNLMQDYEKILNPEEDRKSNYYFDLLRIDLSSLKLSVFTSTNLSNSLQKVKSYFGLKFFAFEDAQVILSPYFKMSESKTIRGVFESVTRFYKQQILEQAPRIVGQQIQNYLRFHLSDLLSTLYDEVYNKLFN